MSRYKEAINMKSVTMLDHDAPRHEYTRISQRFISTLKTATAICTDERSHW
jgi:hypothetical protein